ncbi:hypothetical protein B0A55_04664 [Friedmanniomyces simplex]|uniref:Uncharacterized protein n=1 Tax=Friedmanniomyces simplex TaxID=329884 RepID=A0A4U0Y1L4_9PEZI|nr:hypothetical protein B0A55_04664 [Friedmanniomyces simplex]
MYHIERDVLLGIIPTVKPTSAKPIRKIICDELDETKIMHLVQDHWLWKYRESKGEEGRGPRPLSEIIQEARTKHLENLRRVEFDIDTEGVRKEDWWFHQQLRRAVESTVRQVNFYNEGGADDYRALIDGDLCRDWNITVKDNMEKQQW